MRITGWPLCCIDMSGIKDSQRFFNSCAVGRFLHLSHDAIEEIARQLEKRRSALLGRLWISEEEDDTTSRHLPTATFSLYVPEEIRFEQICCDPPSERIFSKRQKPSPVHSLDENGIVWKAFIRGPFEELLVRFASSPPDYTIRDHRRFASPAD